jgi:hypothetical protein
VEGCVRETFGALVATWQAREARDPEIRLAMGAIARDEQRHAALAFRVAAWASSRLDRNDAHRVERARRRALCELRSEFARDPAPGLVHAAGLPTSRDAMRLLDALTRALAPAGERRTFPQRGAPASV